VGSLYLIAISEWLLAEMAVGSGLFESPRPFFVPVVIKQGFSLFALGGFNSWFLFPWFLF